MAAAELVIQLEVLAKANAGYESQIAMLSKARTAADAEAKSSAITLRRAQQGLKKFENLSKTLAEEVRELKAKLSSTVQAGQTNLIQSNQAQQQLGRTHSTLEKEHGQTQKALKAARENVQQLTDKNADLTGQLLTIRDSYTATKTSLQETERLLSVEKTACQKFELAAQNAKRGLDLLQGSLPSQVQALNDAKTAAMAEAEAAKATLDRTNATLLRRENELSAVRASLASLTRKADSDGKIASDEIRRLTEHSRRLQEQVNALHGANAIGDRQLMLEARAKERSDAQGSTIRQKANLLTDEKLALGAECQKLKDYLSAERDEHRRTAHACAQAAGEQAPPA